MKKQTSPLKMILLILIFWVIVFFGPAILAIWNILSPFSMKEGSLEYTIFQVVCQAAAIVVAWAVSVHVFGKSYSRCLAVNCIIVAVLEVVLGYLSFLAGNGILYMVACAISAATSIYLSVRSFKDYDEQSKLD